MHPLRPLPLPLLAASSPPCLPAAAAPGARSIEPCCVAAPLDLLFSAPPPPSPPCRSNCMYATIAVAEGEPHPKRLARSLAGLLLRHARGRQRALSACGAGSRWIPLSHPATPHRCMPSALPPPHPTPPCAGRYGVFGLLRCWAVSYCCNLLGALMLVGLMLGGDVFAGGRADFVIE